MKTTVSVVIPVYGCAACLGRLHAELARALRGVSPDYEIIFVDDASPDDAWGGIQALAAKDRRVRGLRLSRNFGQHQAIAAGLSEARGTHVVVMDCDLQDDPSEIPRLFAELNKGYDGVVARRSHRQDSAWKRGLSDLFYRLMGFLTDTRLDASVANFGVFKSEVIRAVGSMGDRTRFFPLMIRWVGFRIGALDVAHKARPEGRSAYSLRRLLRLGTEVALTFSNKPLRIIVNLGFLVSAVAAVYAAYVLYLSFAQRIAVPGWTSVIISVWFLSGIQLIGAGIVGIYIGKVFDATKGRPGYIIGRTVNRRGRS
jgi:dolichol-phosphate mannosyltransferase